MTIPRPSRAIPPIVCDLPRSDLDALRDLSGHALSALSDPASDVEYHFIDGMVRGATHRLEDARGRMEITTPTAEDTILINLAHGGDLTIRIAAGLFSLPGDHPLGASARRIRRVREAIGRAAKQDRRRLDGARSAHRTVTDGLAALLSATESGMAEVTTSCPGPSVPPAVLGRFGSRPDVPARTARWVLETLPPLLEITVQRSPGTTIYDIGPARMTRVLPIPAVQILRDIAHVPPDAR